MNIFDLPIETDETIEDKTRAFIYENKLVCHPDLLARVIAGMNILRASAQGFDQTVKLEDENENQFNG